MNSKANVLTRLRTARRSAFSACFFVLGAIAFLTTVPSSFARMNAPVQIEFNETKEELLRFFECHPDLIGRGQLKVFRNDIYSMIRIEGSEICKRGNCPTMIYKPNDKNNRCGLNIYAGSKIAFPDAFGPELGRNTLNFYLVGEDYWLTINALFDPPVLTDISPRSDK
jgi:hypothetical protein